MSKSPRSTLLFGAAALTLTLGLAGCGASGNGPSASEAGGASEVDKSAPLYDELPESIKDAGEMVVVGDSHPPFRTIETDGKTITGIDPDIQAALSEVLGVPIRMEISEGLPQMLNGLQSGRYDAFNGPVSATPERLVDFDGVSWLTSRTSYLIPTDGGLDAEDTGDLCGTKAAGTKGSITEVQTEKLSEWCEARGEDPVTYLGLADTNATLLAVKSGRADTASVTQTAALDISNHEKDQWRYVSQTEEQGAGVDQLVWLTSKDAELGPVMLKAFQEIFDNGDYQAIIDEYGMQDVAIDKPELNPKVK